jgi:hypothetical protein
MSRGHLAAALAAAALTLAAPASANAFSFPLSGWWPLNDGSGQTVRDWSGHGNHGFLGSAPSADDSDPAWVKGVFLGSALRFDGNNDFVTIPDSTDLEPKRLTIAAWVRNDGSPGNFRYIMGKGAYNCTNSSWGLYTGPEGGLGFYIADTEAFHRTPLQDQSVWDGQWHHVAGTYDGAVLRLFVDGKEVGVGTRVSTTIDYTNPAGGANIGAYPTGSECGHGPLSLMGDIDGVQLWSTALPIDTIWKFLKPLFTTAR